MAGSRSERINKVVRACLRECYGAAAPLVRIAEFIARLRVESDLPEEEIRAIEIAVLRLIGGLVLDGPDQGPDLRTTNLSET